MTTAVFAMVLGAAFLHAAWNALVKVNADRLVMVAIMMTAQTAVSVLAVSFVPAPTQECWPFIWASAVLHSAYYLFLVTAYRHGDLSHVYPIARGSSPLIVSLISVVVVGEALSRGSTIAIALIAVGVMSLAPTRGARGLGEPKAVCFALGTGLLIAAYTVVDALGARLAHDAHSYVVWLNLFKGIPIVLAAVCLRRDRIGVQVRASWRPCLLSGIVSLAAYWIVVWAMTLAPMAFVSAVRETGMVFAVLFGVLFLKERLNLARLASTAVTLAGAVMLKLSR